MCCGRQGLARRFFTRVRIMMAPMSMESMNLMIDVLWPAGAEEEFFDEGADDDDAYDEGEGDGEGQEGDSEPAEGAE
jgi:hypothetical protein